MDAAIIAIFFAKLTKAIDVVNTFNREWGYVSPWKDEAGNEVPSPVAEDFMLMEPPRADGTWLSNTMVHGIMSSSSPVGPWPFRRRLNRSSGVTSKNYQAKEPNLWLLSIV